MAKIKWQKAKIDKDGKTDPAYRGIYYRIHASRKFKVGSVSRKDRSYAIFYGLPDGRQTSEVIGWESQWEGDTSLLEEAKRRRDEYVKNVRAIKEGQGAGPINKKEKRDRVRELRRINNKKFRQAKRENQTLNEYWHKTYLPQAKRDKALRSWKTEQGYFHNWISPVIGGKPMKQISQIHVERIKKNLMKEGRAPGTVRYVLAVIRQIFNQAGLSEQNPTKGVKRPRKDNKRERFLKEEEASKLLAELLKRSQQLHDVSLLALHCGLRFGEIAGLTWADVDINNGTLLIKDPKSTHNRYAFLTDDTKAIFERLLIEKDSEQPLVFPSRKGGKMSQASKAFNKAVEALSLNQGITDPRQKVCFHTLRHTFASWLALRGTPMLTLARLLGHSTTAMTERYSHLSPDDLRAAAMQLNELQNMRPMHNHAELVFSIFRYSDSSFRVCPFNCVNGL